MRLILMLSEAQSSDFFEVYKPAEWTLDDKIVYLVNFCLSFSIIHQSYIHERFMGPPQKGLANSVTNHITIKQQSKCHTNGFITVQYYCHYYTVVVSLQLHPVITQKAGKVTMTGHSTWRPVGGSPGEGFV